MNRLISEFAKKADMSKPLAEYPRPQMERDSYVNLNGKWDYAILKTGEELKEYQGKILVPFSPESILSGVERTVTPEDTLYYRTSFVLPEGFVKDKVFLNFGAVDYICEVRLNGKTAGAHKGGYLPFSIDITALLTDGENELTLSVIDPSETGGQARGKQQLKRGGIFYTPQAGIWQTVWLESVPEKYVKSLKITPDIDSGSVTVEVGSNGYDSCKISVFDGDKLMSETEVKDGKATLKIDGFEVWSPENPKLYNMTVKLDSDTVKSYFGMRKYGIGNDKNGIVRLMLNNKPYFHNGLLDQGYFSDGLYTAPSEEAMLNDIVTMKDAGFNMLRKHIKVEPLRWYYLCDKYGMLVWQDMVSGGSACNTPLNGVMGFLGIKPKDNKYALTHREKKEDRDEFYRDTQGTVELLYNVVSICLWVPFNESWGQFDALKVCDFVRGLDNTRPIDHASGWHDQGGGDFNSAHIYFKPLTVPKKDKYGRCMILSEFGGYSYPAEGHVFNSEHSFGYKKYYSKEALTEAYTKLFETQVYPLIPKGLSATVYTQVSDVEDEINGLLTYDRAVLKIDAERLREINAKMKL